MRNRTRLLLADDSALMQQLARDGIGRDGDFEIIATCGDAQTLLRRLRSDAPDVIVFDVEAPRLGGIATIKQLMGLRPTAIVVFSSLTNRTADLGVAAMAAGAVSVVKRPQTTLPTSLQDATQRLLAAIRDAARARFRQPNAMPTTASGLTGASLVPSAPLPMATGTASTASVARPVSGTLPIASPQSSSLRNAAIAPAMPDLPGMRSKNSADAMLPMSAGQRPMSGGEKVIALGASTGGTQALETVLTTLDPSLPGIVIVQHMPERFTGMFAARLNSLCKLEIKEAANGDKVQRGRVLLAPGGKHMMLKRSGTGYTVEVVDGPLVNRHKPSVDLLFRSVAMAAGGSALGVLMTGIGDDGARGLMEMRDAGATTLAQDEASCVVFGMPKVAIAMGSAQRVVPLGQIGKELASFR